MYYKDLWVVFFPKCTAGLKRVVSCCIRLHTTTNSHATTPTIVGATILGVVAPVCTQPKDKLAVLCFYCIYTSVMNTYCVNKRGFQFLPSIPLFLFFPPHSPTTLSSPPVSFSLFFRGNLRDLNQRFPVTLAYLSLCHTTRPRRFVEIPWSKSSYLCCNEVPLSKVLP